MVRKSTMQGKLNFTQTCYIVHGYFIFYGRVIVTFGKKLNHSDFIAHSTASIASLVCASSLAFQLKDAIAAEKKRAFPYICMYVYLQLEHDLPSCLEGINTRKRPSFLKKSTKLTPTLITFQVCFFDVVAIDLSCDKCLHGTQTLQARHGKSSGREQGG